MRKLKHDLTGRRFGRLEVISDAGAGKHRVRHWLCRCDCGKTLSRPTTQNLLSGATRSCGCYRNDRNTELARERARESGGPYSRTHLYCVWRMIRKRCNNKQCKEYSAYGGRGVTVCSEWDNFHVFRCWALENGYQKGKALKRLAINGQFSPSNCEWVDAPRTYTGGVPRILTYNGVSKSLTDWARDLGCGPSTIHARLTKGWSLKEALTTPVRPQKPRWKEE